MKVVLLQDVKSQGKKGDVIEVSDSVRNEYNFAPPEGKQLSSSQNMPVWIDIPPATREELIADAKPGETESSL